MCGLESKAGTMIHVYCVCTHLHNWVLALSLCPRAASRRASFLSGVGTCHGAGWRSRHGAGQHDVDAAW